MSIVVGILTFMSRINFILSRVEYEKSFITSGPVSSKTYNWACAYSEDLDQSVHLHNLYRVLVLLPEKTLDPWPPIERPLKTGQTTGASPVFTVWHKEISLVYSLFQYIIRDGILLSWTGPCGSNCADAQTDLRLRKAHMPTCPFAGHWLILTLIMPICLCWNCCLLNKSAAYFHIQPRTPLLSVEANTMNPDQTASKGAVWSDCILFAIWPTKVHRQMREQTAVLWMTGKGFDWLQSLKQFFINVSYHILVASLTLMALKSHQS